MQAKGPTRIKHCLDTSFSSHSLEKIAKGFSIHRIWPSAVGENIAKRAWPLKLAGKILYVTVATSTWMEELKYLKRDILKKINHALREDSVEEIVFRLGKIDETQNKKSESHAGKKEIVLSQKDIDEIEMIIVPVKDKELKDIIRKGIINSRR